MCGAPLLGGPVAVDDASLRPRYWATIWAAVDGAALAQGTLRGRLAAIDALYRHADVAGEDLDALISDNRIDRLGDVATGHFLTLRVRTSASGVDTIVAWETTRRFLSSVLRRISGGVDDDAAFARLDARLRRFEQQLENLAPHPRRWRRMTIRALPALVVEELYDIMAPRSPRNPFRTERLAWRNWCLLITLLHQGLRTGEALLLTVDPVKSGVHPRTGEVAYWMNVTDLRSEEDPRFAERPVLKTEHSERQIPATREVASFLHHYEVNWRGRRAHPFLFVNPRGGPLSTRGVRQVFETVSTALSATARQVLIDNLRDPLIRPHDLRHTCAVVRLSHLRESGRDEEEAVEQLRALFGWSRTSEMPHHYARAYFEACLAAAWRDGFDKHVAALRKTTPPVIGIELK